jgi:hypothetical protein
VALARIAELCRNVWDVSPGGKVLSIQRCRKVYNDRLIEKAEIWLSNRSNAMLLDAFTGRA